MDSFVIGNMIRTLREKEHMTQTELASLLNVSNKTVSKWENGKGLPDITLLEPLSKALNVSLIEFISGYTVVNRNTSANIKRGQWYVCPVCGNVIHTVGSAVVSCCGITLPPLEPEECDPDHNILCEKIDGEYFVSIDHPMEKSHYVCFIAYATDSCLQVEKLYPEQEAYCRFRIAGHGKLFCCCNHHGLYERRI